MINIGHKERINRSNMSGNNEMGIKVLWKAKLFFFYQVIKHILQTNSNK